MKTLKFLSLFFKKAIHTHHLGITLDASKNIMGTPGGGIKEGAYWVYRAQGGL